MIQLATRIRLRSTAVLLACSGFAWAQSTVEQGSAVQLTDTGARNGQAFWSPDGKSISFVSNRSGSWQVWMMASDGARPRQLTRSAGSAGWPSWHPNGSAILYYAQMEGRYRLLRLDLSTGESTSILEAKAQAQDFRPLLSNDGKRLLFDRFSDNHDIYVSDLSDGTITQLTSDPGYDSDARWSPDGRRIVFHSDRRGGARSQLQVFVMDSDGSSLQQLTQGPHIHGYPCWSPDGQRIAYISENGEGDRDIWVMDAGGSNPAPLVQSPGFDGDPAWSPDGSRLVFSTDRFGGQELAVISVAGEH